ncbi:MAG: bifunctional oligoribonuclease/PAP phosphatase NrnA [bacterium]|nr:bifunctional oligoribonuclease/PAP phosphatase NrnA [bacterium]
MKQAKEIIDIVSDAHNVVITSHKSPDGDSIGSSLGLYRFLKSLNIQSTICHPDPCPNFLDWAKRSDHILDFENDTVDVKEAMAQADVIFSLDYNGAGRLGDDMGALLTDAKAKKIMIDHHLNPDDIFDVSVSHPEVGSTSQLIFELIDASGNLDKLTKEMVEPLYLGIMTDTGSFRFDSVNARTHEIIAQMLKTGLNHTAIHENTFDGNRLDKLKLRGYAISEKLEIISEMKTAIVSLTDAEMQRFNFIKGDTEGLVNVALSVEGVEMAAFFAEKDGKIKISFRSKGPAVNEIAADHFQGGGHKFAAGGISFDSMEATIERFKSVIPKYVK